MDNNILTWNIRTTHKEIDFDIDELSPVTSSMPNIDEVAFMEPFNVSDISEIKTSLKKSGIYTSEQIEEIVSGLDTI